MQSGEWCSPAVCLHNKDEAGLPAAGRGRSQWDLQRFTERSGEREAIVTAEHL